MFDCLTGRPNYSDCDYPPQITSHTPHFLCPAPLSSLPSGARSRKPHTYPIPPSLPSQPPTVSLPPPAICRLLSTPDLSSPFQPSSTSPSCPAPKLLLLLLTPLLLLLFLATSEATQAAPMHSGIQDSRHLIYTKPRPHHDICQRCHADSHT